MLRVVCGALALLLVSTGVVSQADAQRPWPRTTGAWTVAVSNGSCGLTQVVNYQADGYRVARTVLFASRDYRIFMVMSDTQRGVADLAGRPVVIHLDDMPIRVDMMQDGANQFFVGGFVGTGPEGAAFVRKFVAANRGSIATPHGRWPLDMRGSSGAFEDFAACTQIYGG